MPINETDKAWVRQEIRTSQQRQGFSKLTGFIKDWSGTSAAVGILLFFVTQWGGYTEFKTHTIDQLANIGTRLDKIDNDLLEVRAADFPENVLHEINGLPQARFNRALPALRTAVEKRDSGVKASPPLLGGIAAKLLKADVTTPDYWPTVLEFLQFASAGLAPRDVPPVGTKPSLRSSSLALINNTFAGMTLVLDGGLIDGDRFINCRVIFTDRPVEMKNVIFVNSVFEFPISTIPPPYIKQASHLLLASDLKSVSIPTL